MSSCFQLYIFAYIYILFCPRKYKIGFVKTFVHWVLMMSSNKLKQELKFIKVIFCDKRNPLDIMQSIINQKIAQFQTA